jgi:hypothetical protein
MSRQEQKQAGQTLGRQQQAQAGRTLSRQEQAQARRTLSRYKRLILLGKLQLAVAEARRLVGPDCAYHLYSLSRHARRR